MATANMFQGWTEAFGHCAEECSRGIYKVYEITSDGRVYRMTVAADTGRHAILKVINSEFDEW